MADKYQAGSSRLVDSQKFLTGKDGTFSGTITASDFQLTGGAAAGAYPTGTVLWWPGATSPTGWIECNGAAISRTTFADLFAVIGTTFGAGNGSSTFNVPVINDDKFIRGWGSSGGLDPGRSFGSNQGGDVGNHSHNTAGNNSAHNHGVNANASNAPHNHGFSVGGANMPHQHNANTSGNNAPHKHGGSINNTGAHNHPMAMANAATNPSNEAFEFDPVTPEQNTSANLNNAGGHSHPVGFPAKNVPHTHPANVGAQNAPHSHPATVGAANAPHNHGNKTSGNGVIANHNHAFDGDDGGTSPSNLTTRPPSTSMVAIIKI